MQPCLQAIREGKPVAELLDFAILNIDKPPGPTSFRVTEIVRKKVRARKAAHFGTLDPMVTGVLPVALNRARKLMRWFIRKDKTYVGVMRLHSDVPESLLRDKMREFVGAIDQMPPLKSRIKRQLRRRCVHCWNVLERDGRDVRFEARVEAGTYISKMIHDLGQTLGGAHMTQLRRTAAGIFTEADETFVTLEGLEEALRERERGNDARLRDILIPAEAVAKVLPVAQAREGSVEELLRGRPVRGEDLVSWPQVEGDVAVFCGNRFIEVARPAGEGEVIARPQFVLS